MRAVAGEELDHDEGDGDDEEDNDDVFALERSANDIPGAAARGGRVFFSAFLSPLLRISLADSDDENAVGAFESARASICIATSVSRIAPCGKVSAPAPIS